LPSYPLRTGLFSCKECEEIFTIEYSLIPIGARYMLGVIKYAVARVLKKGDSINMVTQDLNELHLVKVSKTTIQRWVNEHGEKDRISTDLSEEDPPDNFSGFLSLDGTFKSAKVKKTIKIWHIKTGFAHCHRFIKEETPCWRFSHGGERRSHLFVKRAEEMASFGSERHDH